ncbi:MAG: metallophosphoesterase [Planctomycetia bacterium]|nr:metallophosphoesterase [Planctomycetia bacterium]
MRAIVAKVRFAILFASVAWAWHSPAAAADFRVNPYLQNPAQDAMTVTWFTQTNTPGSLNVNGVTLTSTPVLTTALAYYPTEITKYFGGVNPGTPYMHRVRVNGLTAGTTYNYSVTQGATTYNAAFRTAPTANSSVRFLVYGDSETEPESTGVKVACSEPYGNWDRPYWLDQTEGYRINLQTMKARNPDFIAIAGDLVESGNEQRDWDEFWKHNAGAYNNIASYVPILPAMGNHENYGGPDGGSGYNLTTAAAAAARYRAYFETPDNGSGNPVVQDRYYRVDYGPITYITLDSSNGLPNDSVKDTNWLLDGAVEAPDFNPGSAQYVWLEEQLADAQATSRFTFVQFHHVPYSVGPHGFNPGDQSGQDTQSGVPMRTLLPLFEEYGVDAVFCGHDEMVEHSVVNGIDFFDTGSAGDGLRGPSAGITNPNQVFLAHVDAPEVWNGAQLVSGGKHYSHLEVNVTEGDHGEFEATIEPVYIFPLMNASGVMYGYERRVYDDVTVLVDPGLPGDANGDGVVNDADASILGAHWQQMGDATWHDGDFNGDCNVTDADAAILASHWNQHRAEQSVPEPTGLMLLAAGLLTV